MSRLERLMSEYAQSHRDATNKRIHQVCVPLIYWSILALLWSLPAPSGLNWALLVLAGLTLYYFWLSLATGLLMLIINLMLSAATWWLDQVLPIPLWLVGAVVFVLAWAGQFWGHRIEGAKPSFFKDLQFLLIGPLWVLRSWRGRV